MEESEEFRKALKELQQAFERTKLYKILIAVLEWMEDLLKRIEEWVDRYDLL